MTKGKFLFIAAAAGAIAFPAEAAITVIGNTAARTCYELTESAGTPSFDSIARCDEALAGSLSSYEQVATLVNRGILKLRLRQVDAAMADFDAAIARDPGQAEAYLNKGMAALHLDNGWQQAVPLFDTALGKGTSRPEIAYFGRAVAHEMGGQVKAAYFDYRQASRLAPKWGDPKAELARFTVRQP
jgi:tetratricopeptide (TPR) repeat protein